MGAQPPATLGAPTTPGAPGHPLLGSGSHPITPTTPATGYPLLGVGSHPIVPTSPTHPLGSNPPAQPANPLFPGLLGGAPQPNWLGIPGPTGGLNPLKPHDPSGPSTHPFHNLPSNGTGPIRSYPGSPYRPPGSDDPAKPYPLPGYEPSAPGDARSPPYNSDWGRK